VEGAGHRSFELWYRRAYGRLSTSMLALTGDRDLAADVTDEAFAREGASSYPMTVRASYHGCSPSA